MVETAKYTVLRGDGEFEIRRYEAMQVATVRDAPSRFSVLFKYITGANRSRSKIAMTSPVIMSTEIAMTSPVFSDNGSMSFMVPSQYDSETVPEPVKETENKYTHKRIQTSNYTIFDKFTHCIHVY